MQSKLEITGTVDQTIKGVIHTKREIVVRPMRRRQGCEKVSGNGSCRYIIVPLEDFLSCRKKAPSW